MLQMTNVEVYYGSVRALDSVTLHVDEGELVTLIGSNGAGTVSYTHLRAHET